MQIRRRNLSSSFEKLVIFTITCGLVLGQSVSQEVDKDSDTIHFPGPSSRSDHRIDEEPTRESNLDDRMLSASLKIAQRINSIESYEEFLRFVGAPTEENLQVFDRFGGEKERSNAERAVRGKCKPELTLVSLKTEYDPAKYVFPPCTRINRCNGCCSNDLISCQPNSTITRNFEVAVSKLNKNLELRYEGREIVALEEHTGCKCGCRIKAEHCNQKQIYQKDICKCICTNIDEERKCRSNSNIKIWNVDNCTCLCREVNQCSTDFHFDQNTCSILLSVTIFCQKTVLRIQDLATRTGYNLGQAQKPESIPPVIVTLDATDPRRKPKDDPEY